MEPRSGALHRRSVARSTPTSRARLERNGIALREDRVARLEGADGILAHVVFDIAASAWPAARCSSRTGQSQRSDLSVRLGCEINDKGTVRTGKYEATHLSGLYVAGDASRAVQWVVVAAAEGAEAAFAINTDLIAEDLAVDARAPAQLGVRPQARAQADSDSLSPDRSGHSSPEHLARSFGSQT